MKLPLIACLLVNQTVAVFFRVDAFRSPSADAVCYCDETGGGGL